MQGEELETESKILSSALFAANIPHVAITGVHFEPDPAQDCPHVGSVFERIQTGDLPYFPVVMSNVGTEMHTLKMINGKRMYVKNEEYTRYI